METLAFYMMLLSLMVNPCPLQVDVVEGLPEHIGGRFIKYGEENTIQVSADSYDKLNTLYHELGHYIDYNYLDDDERKAYQKWRGISDWCNEDEWRCRPREAFAEDFQNMVTDMMGRAYNNKTDLKRLDQNGFQWFRRFLTESIN